MSVFLILCRRVSREHPFVRQNSDTLTKGMRCWCDTFIVVCLLIFNFGSSLAIFLSRRWWHWAFQLLVDLLIANCRAIFEIMWVAMFFFVFSSSEVDPRNERIDIQISFLAFDDGCRWHVWRSKLDVTLANTKRTSKFEAEESDESWHFFFFHSFFWAFFVQLVELISKVWIKNKVPIDVLVLFHNSIKCRNVWWSGAGLKWDWVKKGRILFRSKWSGKSF